MPSSRDGGPAVSALQLAELRPDAAVSVAAAPADPAPLHLFEVAGRASVPENLIGPARAAAEAAGWAAGWASGMRSAAERTAAEAERVRAANEQALADHHAARARSIAALDAAAARLEERALPGAEELEHLIVGAAMAIAEALVGHALADDATRAPATLRRALALAPADEPVTVRLSPADHALLRADPGAVPGGRDITLVIDATLADGDAVATSGALEIDARIRQGVHRVREVLGQ